MATEKIKALKIDTADSVKSINELKQEVDDLKKKLEDQSLSQEEAKKLSEELSQAQQKLASSMSYAKEQSQRLDGSYAQLQAKLQGLQKEFQKTQTEVGRSNQTISSEVTQLTSEMRALQAESIKTGGTLSGFGNAISQIGSKECSQLVSGLQGISGSLKILEADPIVAVIAVAAASLLKLVSAIKKNETAIGKLSDAFSRFKPIINAVSDAFNGMIVAISDLISKGFDKLGKALDKVTGKLSAFFHKHDWNVMGDAMDKLNQKIKQGNELAAENKRIREENITLDKESLNLQKEIADLKVEQAKAEKDSVEQKKATLDLEDKQLELAKRNYRIQVNLYNQLKKQNEGREMTTQMMREETEAYKKMKEAEAELYNISAKRYEDTIKSVGHLKGSYNDLSQQLSELKAQWQATNDEAERARLAKQIKVLDGRLARLDFSIGDFSKRAGNYRYALEMLGQKGAGAVVGGIRGINEAAKTLFANPIFATIAVVGGILAGIVKAIQSNERAVRSITKVFAPLKGITNSLKNALDWITDQLTRGITWALDKVVEGAKKTFKWLGDIAGKLGLEKVSQKMYGVVDAMNAQAEVTAELQKMEIERRNIAEENAELELELAKTRMQYKQATGDTVKQAKIAQRIGELDNQIKQNSYDLAKKEYDIIKKENSLRQSTQSDLDRESAARIAMLKAESELYNMEKEEVKALKNAASEREKELTEVEKLIKMLTDWATKQTEDMELTEAALTERYEKELKMLEGHEKEKAILTKKYDQELKAAREKRAKKELTDLANIYATGLDNIEKEYLDAELDIEKNYENNQSERDLRLNELENKRLKDLKAAAELYLSQLLREQEAMIEQGLDTTEIDKKIAEVYRVIANLGLSIVKSDKEIQDMIRDSHYQFFADQLSMLEEFAAETASIGDGISSEWAGVFAKMQDGLLAIRTLREDEKKQWKSYSGVIVASMAVASQMMIALADEQDENTKEGFENQKKFQMAAVIMNGAAGILSAWTSAMSPENSWMTVWGQVAMGTAMSALIGTLMGVQLSKIANTQFGGSSTSSASPTSAITSSLVAPVQYTSEVAGAYTEEAQGDQRYYVSVVEIEDVGGKVSVAENESRY